jgi:hypothetical protein
MTFMKKICEPDMVVHTCNISNRSVRHEDNEFEASLSCMVRPCRINLKKKKIRAS